MDGLNILWWIMGILCIGYFLAIVIIVGLANIFHLIWLGLGLVFCVIGYIPCKMFWINLLPVWGKGALLGVLVIGILLYCFVLHLIFTGFAKTDASKLDYVLVLGAQVKKRGLSRALKYRVDKAGEYLLLNPQLKVVVSGGKGYNEPMSEAKAMSDYLKKQYAIEEERIILEDKSTSTAENLVFSKAFIPKNAAVGITTSDYHSYRARKIAKKAGYVSVFTIPSHSEKWLLPTNLLRESLAVIKDYLVGNI